jgi:hypothetical protein
MRASFSDMTSGGDIWKAQLFTDVEEDLCVEFPCQGVVGRYSTTEWCFPVREVLGLIVEEMRRDSDPRAEWLDCLANSFYGDLDPAEVYLGSPRMTDGDFQDFLRFLVDERDATFESIRAGKCLFDEWGTSLDEAPPTTIDFVFPCRKLVKSDEDLWTFPARWVLKLIEADLIRRNDPEAKDFRDLVAYFYPEVQPAYWSTIGAIPS